MLSKMESVISKIGIVANIEIQFLYALHWSGTLQPYN